MQSSALAVQGILPVIAKREFHASVTQTTLITAAPTVLFVCSIFWNGLFARRRFGAYVAVYWLVSSVPLALVGLATEFWHLLALQLVSCVGLSGLYPAAGELLKRLYPDGRRGRVYSGLYACTMLATAAASYGVGRWMNIEHNAFRWYMPIAAVAQLAGLAILTLLAVQSGAESRRVLAAKSDQRGLTRALRPILHMRGVLKDDPIFARYEAAYMTYGIGWMVCTALLPLLVTDKLHLPYDQITQSTQVLYVVGVVLCLLPVGRLMDKLGPSRTSGLSFLALAGYPIGLAIAGNQTELGAVSLFYGLAHAGVNLGWMLGPVSLAPTPDKVPQYVAIHSTLVGLRGSIFQGAGVLLYEWSQSFTPPLVLAAAAFVWAAWQMYRLHQRMTVPGRAVEPAAAEGGAATENPETV